MTNVETELKQEFSEIENTEIKVSTTPLFKPVVVDHIVNVHHCHRGDPLVFFTRVAVREALSDLTLSIEIPAGLTLNDYQKSPAGPLNVNQNMDTLPQVAHPTNGSTVHSLSDTSVEPLEAPQIHTELIKSFSETSLMRTFINAEPQKQNQYLIWSLAGDLAAGSSYEYRTEVVAEPTTWDLELESKAMVTDKNQTVLNEESLSLTVLAKGKYLRYLPAVYERDEFMGRFLMLFESFWEPLRNQMGAVPYYLDPRMTPAAFLPWLASWLDLKLDEQWPEESQRRLIRWAIALHRSRGTKWGLLKYLEIYTGQVAEIIEYLAMDFSLGEEALLGLDLALGCDNQPHTFIVKLRLPPVAAENEQEHTRLDKLRQQTIKQIIDMQKPAHTVYSLEIIAADLETELTEQVLDSSDVGPEAEHKIAAQAAIWFKLDDEPSSSNK